MTVVILIVKDTPLVFSELHMKIKTVRCNNSAFFLFRVNKTRHEASHSPPEDPEAPTGTSHRCDTLLQESAVGKTQITNEISLIALFFLLDLHVY